MTANKTCLMMGAYKMKDKWVSGQSAYFIMQMKKRYIKGHDNKPLGIEKYVTSDDIYI
jgi:hypothetical protein